ncbi:hypothetical protein IV417_02050 [Alphaproteobacteria bacterium KMM 3653]|uniref:Holin-X, holin superfamily III n=1 Tax=Harenicola maris TaxID=2841044 RepID=A0AAP2G6C7_9RHOB|nr:hypothetical protein [Harenicola maris]
MFGIEQKLARTAKRAGLLSGGLLLCLIGAAFLTVAVWFALLPEFGPGVTALIIGGGYLGLGCICLGLGAGGGAAVQPQVPLAAAEAAPAPGATPESPPIVQAFVYGLQTGSKAGQARH